MDEREERLARNEMLFRSVNENIEEAASSARSVMPTFEFFCECSSVGCVDRLLLSRADYERARSNGDLFLVSPGHEDVSVERVVERHPAFLIVEKQGTAGVIARSADPR